MLQCKPLDMTNHGMPWTFYVLGHALAIWTHRWSSVHTWLCLLSFIPFPIPFTYTYVYRTGRSDSAYCIAAERIFICNTMRTTMQLWPLFPKMWLPCRAAWASARIWITRAISTYSLCNSHIALTTFPPPLSTLHRLYGDECCWHEVGNLC